jgi:tRNA threonylcarbamoyl adenosine modification protein YeaZ
MKILAIEFSSAQRSVAVMRAATPSAPSALGEAMESGGRTTNGLALVEAALKQTGLEREEIECLVVGLGPGSYNGIRVGIALAQGWQLATGVKLLGISSAECVAAQAQADGLRGRAAVAIDAQRNEFYLAVYELGAGDYHEVEPLRLVQPAEVTVCQTATGCLIGPDLGTRFPGSTVVVPRAATLARLALGRTNYVSGEQLEPIYLRQTTFVKAPPPRKY